MRDAAQLLRADGRVVRLLAALLRRRAACFSVRGRQTVRREPKRQLFVGQKSFSSAAARRYAANMQRRLVLAVGAVLTRRNGRIARRTAMGQAAT